MFKSTSNLKHSNAKFAKSTYIDQVKLKEHRRTHSKKRKEKTKVVKPPEEEIRKFQCEKCGKGFRTNSELKQHFRSHSDMRIFKCGLCIKSFKTQGELRRHSIIHDSSKREYNCEKCGKDFKWPWNLKRHLEHEKQERNFKCPICGKAFKTNGNLRQHRVNYCQGKIVE